VRDYLGLEASFYPYPDTASLYVGLRNGECDFAVRCVQRRQAGRATLHALLMRVTAGAHPQRRGDGPRARHL
jgi:hypothetical protein